MKFNRATDFIRAYLPFRGPSPDQAHRPSGIFQHAGMPISLRAKAILDYETGNPIGHQPIGISFAFMRRQAAVTTARQNHHR